MSFVDQASESEVLELGRRRCLADIDVETVALHESGHGLSLGHFRPPPDAVMNPIYAGIRQDLFATDDGANCTLYGSWPNP